MKINQVIRNRRKELALTQEQLADALGVSTPAVNKWEKGSSYPDITLLPALARLLKIDLNTLLSFSEDLTDTQIHRFVNELDKTAREQNYEAAFQMAMDKIHEYPNCDKLIYFSVLYLEEALLLCSAPEREPYRKTFETFYERLAANETPEIRDTAICMLIAYARNRGEYEKAEERIHMLPFSRFNKEEQLAVLYQQQKKYEDAEKIWEHRILAGVAQIHMALIHVLEIALGENRDADAKIFADLYETVIRQFSLPEWMRYNAHFMLAIEKKNKAESLRILSKMLPAMKEEWNPQDCRLYRHMKGTGSAFVSGKAADLICEELRTKEEYAFLRDSEEFQALMAQRNG